MCENRETIFSKITGFTKTRRIEVSYEWKIENFSLIGKLPTEYIETPLFSSTYNDDIKWHLKLYPKNYRLEASEYISVFIISNSTDTVKQLEAEHKSVVGATDLIKRSQLIKNEDVLPNDCLSLVCEIVYCVDLSTSFTLEHNVPSFTACNCHLQDGYKSLFNSQELSDVILVASNKELSAHKAILAAHSPVFLAMFNKNTKESIENRVNILDIDFDILQEMLRFIYCGTVENIETIVQDLMIAADKYHIKTLKDECEKYLCGKLCLTNLTELLHKADMHNASILRNYAIQFLISHKNELVDTNVFESINNLQPQTVLKIIRELIVQKK